MSDYILPGEPESISEAISRTNFFNIYSFKFKNYSPDLNCRLSRFYPKRMWCCFTHAVWRLAWQLLPPGL